MRKLPNSEKPEISLDLTGCQVRHPYINFPVKDLATDVNLFRYMARGGKCIALFAAPTVKRQRLTLTWAPAENTLGAEWVPFYSFRSDLSGIQNAHRMLYALKNQPILFNGDYTPVDYCKAVY